jgi:DNA-binding transcriptional ArsR family regulator
MLEFVKMPSFWIIDQTLSQLKWDGKDNAAGVSALMLYISIAHKVNSEANKEFSGVGFAKLSYSDFERIVGLSRAKIAGGLKKLEEIGIITTDKGGKTSVYQLVGYNPKEKWAKLPCRYLYKNECIKVFSDFHLRHKNELNALKMYLLAVAFRDNTSNHAIISYEKINHYTGISENDICYAISLLVNLKLIQVDRSPTESIEGQTEGSWTFKHKNMYRLIGLKGRHLGNTSSDDVKHYTAGT